VRFPEQYRAWCRGLESNIGDDYGLFIAQGPCGRELRIIASSGEDDGIEWEHVSVSLPNRCPNWPEMCFVKELFWDDEETVMQLHPPKSEWVNNHSFCLHLWRPRGHEIPRPPSITVGDRKLGTLTGR
jgi:hypothetical protein